MTKDDFEVFPSGTHQILDEQKILIESVKERLRMIIDAYPASHLAHACAKDALQLLEANKTGGGQNGISE